ncbi:MAG TPA: hypothetical protein VMK12_05440 [Anaeromyxobacteraceae bacterium]|nr:hypothetical protein [Anaeromyxobacteraceae bacterium]
MSYASPNWKLLLGCACRLTEAGRTPFTRSMLIDCVQRIDPTRKETSLNPTIQGMTDNLQGGNSSGLLHPSFHSVGRGEFVLLDAAIGDFADDESPAPSAGYGAGPAADTLDRTGRTEPRGPGGSGRRIGLIGCVKEKEPQAAPARSLYRSPLFRARLAYVERSCSSWFVLSAEYGLVHPDRWIEPYDVTLKDESPARRRVWTQDVLAELSRVLGDLRGAVVEIHAGAAYRDSGLVEGIEDRGAVVAVPAESLGLGKQLRFYSEATERLDRVPS